MRKLPRILRALRRVRHLGMELQAVDRQRAVLDRGDRAGVGGGQRHEIVRRPATPGRRGSSRLRSRRARRRTARRALVMRQSARPYSRAGALSTSPAERLAGQLHAVADAQHGHAEAEDLRIALRRARLVDAGRPAGEDEPLGGQLADPLGRDVVPDDLAVDVLLRAPAGRSAGRTASRNRGPAPFRRRHDRSRRRAASRCSWRAGTLGK